jgi:hypothetical protein
MPRRGNWLIDRLTKYIPLSLNRLQNTREPFPPHSHRARWWSILISWITTVLKRISTISTFFVKRSTNETLLYVGFEVLTAVVMENTVLWDITPCSPLKVNRRFGGAYRLHLQGRISRARYQRESIWHSDCGQSRRVFKICIMVFYFTAIDIHVYIFFIWWGGT